MIKTHHFWRFWGDALWLEKRRMFFAALSAETKTAEAEKSEKLHDLGAQQILEAHKQLNPEQAELSSQKMLKAHHQKVHEITDVWSERFYTRTKFGFGEIESKQKLREHLEKVAKDKVKEAVNEKKTAADIAQTHLSNCFLILHYKAKAAEELKANIDADMAANRQLLESANGALGFFKRRRIEKGILRLEKVAGAAEDIATEAKTELESSDKVQKIKQWKDGILQRINQLEPGSAAVVRLKLRDAIMTGSKSIFLTALREAGIQQNDPAYEIMENMAHMLIHGEAKGRWFGSYFGLTPKEVKDYLVKELADQGVIEFNKKGDDVKTRLERMGKLSEARIIFRGRKEPTYYLIRKDEGNPKGFLLRSAEDKKALAYININDPTKPIVTFEKFGNAPGTFEEPKGLHVNNSVAKNRSFIFNLESVPAVQVSETVATTAAAPTAPAESSPPAGGGFKIESSGEL